MNCNHRYVKLLISAISVICMATPLAASATEDDPGAWITFSTTDAFKTDGEDSRWRYWFDAQARYFDLGGGVNQWLVRPGLGYEISDNVNGWVGYARFRTRNSAGEVADENRYWQQIDWTAGRWNSGRLSMRLRFEQRSVSVGDDVGFVLRYMAKYVRPIGESGNTNLIIGIEPIVDLRDTDWGGEAGYMNQYLWRDDAENRSNHLGVLSFRVIL